MMLDLRVFIDRAVDIVRRHNLGVPGEYRRWLRQDEAGLRDLGVNPYGAADAANILYTVGEWPAAAERSASVEVLSAMQDARSGLFHEEARRMAPAV